MHGIAPTETGCMASPLQKLGAWHAPTETGCMACPYRNWVHGVTPALTASNRRKIDMLMDMIEGCI